MKKKLIGILLSLALLLTLPLGTTTALATDVPTMRVLLSIGDQTSFGVNLNGAYYITADGVSIGDIGAAGYTAAVVSGAAGPIVVLYNSAGTPLAQGANVTLTPVDAVNGTISITHPSYGSRSYRGSFTFTADGANLRLVNTLDLETYLYGVVPYEMSDSFPIEALKAQAVCARNFAYKYQTSSGYYDLGDTTTWQVYKGFDATKTNSIAAVDATRGKVLTYGGNVITCYYSASNGGWTEITQHRWTETEPLKAYDQIQQDPYDIANPSSLQERLWLPITIAGDNPIQYQNWTNGNYAANENSATGVDTVSRYMRLCALEAVRAQGYIGNVTDDIQILGFSNIVPHTYDTANGQHHGGVAGVYDGNDVTGINHCHDVMMADVTMNVMANRYGATDATGGYLFGDVDKNGSISIADYTLVRLHILGLKALEGDAPNIADVDRNGSISIADYTYIRLHILGLKGISSRTNDGVISEPIQVTFTITFSDMDVGGPYQCFFVPNLGMFIVETDGTNWYIYQRRYGHGIGMSQRGAQQRAKSIEEGGAGQTCEQILDFYFPDYQGYPTVDLQTLY